MAKTQTPSALYDYSNQYGTRVISEYKNDIIFEQPREGLLKQEFKSYEKLSTGGVKVTTTYRTFKNNDYFDTSTTEILV